MNSQPKQPRPLGAVRDELTRKYTVCRSNLLLVILFTVINMFTISFNNSYFLFSATIPTLFPSIGLGMAAETGDNMYLYVFIALGLIATLPYLFCWIFSKKRVGWMVAALVFFSFDCLFLLLNLDLSMIIDILVHAWVMFYLITGVRHGFKLRDLPAEEPPMVGAEAVDTTAGDELATDGNAAADTATETASETADEAPAFDESIFDYPAEDTNGDSGDGKDA